MKNDEEFEFELGTDKILSEKDFFKIIVNSEDFNDLKQEIAILIEKYFKDFEGKIYITNQVIYGLCKEAGQCDLFEKLEIDEEYYNFVIRKNKIKEAVK